MVSGRYRQALKQSGVALISVLLTVAILMAIAARLMTGHNLTINQHQNVFEQNQALQYAIGAEALARQALLEDFTSGGGEVDHYNELWAQPVLPFELDEGGFLEAQLTDLQGCFNLNNLSGADKGTHLGRFRRLLDNVGVQRQLADAVVDWVDSDEVVTGFGAEDSEYLLSEIPRRAANQMITDISELAQLNNVVQEELELVLPHVCVIPDSESLINVNTANVQTLASLDQNLAPGTIEGIVSNVREYASVQEFAQQNPDFTPVAGALSVSSRYFRLHAFAQVGESSVTLQSVLFRDPNTGEVTVLGRDFGKLFRSNVDVQTENAS